MPVFGLVRHLTGGPGRVPLGAPIEDIPNGAPHAAAPGSPNGPSEIGQSVPLMRRRIASRATRCIGGSSPVTACAAAIS